MTRFDAIWLDAGGVLVLPDPTVLGPLLAAIMVVNSVVSVFYYLAIARQMIFQPLEDTTPVRTPVLLAGVVGLSMAALLFFFLLPGTFSRLADISTLVA